VVVRFENSNAKPWLEFQGRARVFHL